MLQTEFVRSLNCNYERILLDKKPEDKRYQYCILSRGGMKGILDCSLRYINGLAYLYYDISSKQNISQYYKSKSIGRKWILDFMWSFYRVRQELERFLLDVNNILWYPEQIFQDIENNVFSFLYVPYYEGENGFRNLLEFLVEHIDYEDEALVDCVYNLYEQYEQSGEIYLQSRIFEDVKCLEAENTNNTVNINGTINKNNQKGDATSAGEQEEKRSQSAGTVHSGAEPDAQRRCNSISGEESREAFAEVKADRMEHEDKTDKLPREERKGFLKLFDSKMKRNKVEREAYRQNLHEMMNEYAVAEDTPYEDCGKTIYIGNHNADRPWEPGLYTPEGRLIGKVSNPVMTVGKKKGEADIVLDDSSVSRVHARITLEEDKYYIEDLNSTNGTCKNGLTLQPYEKRMLDKGDEIGFGRETVVFR